MPQFLGYTLGSLQVSNPWDFMNKFMMGVSDLIEGECRILLMIWIYIVSCVCPQTKGVKNYEGKSYRKIRGLRGKGISLFMMGSMGMVILRIDKSFLDKAILFHLSMMMRECLTLDRKEYVVSPHLLLVVGVVRGMKIGIWPVEMAVTDVVRVAI